ncbi:sodium/proton antiporter (CPA1 family) [Hasllibacter halocynthiae]|uniref:Sodium/proton antiporter (CPA1 family) n=1 Tax=Hasllibacter halocynthiae TaxID=595589 RepID=A0A2T0X8C4_9RHOB|nr:cation:proton antiporter [Hasllibacter halocynthiae]PRY95155.1 sodium/proton antiporter (CPA1 family) [Hasllibacter halocynthiae]
MLDWPTIDMRDLIYGVLGLALLGLTFQTALGKYRLVNIPFFYILGGIAVAALGFPMIDPRDGAWESAAIEHISELIVIISLAGAGLAIDTPMNWRNWKSAFMLLLVAMPLTIAATAFAGVAWLGLPLAGALLLAAALAPTDPVMARTVQVAPPGKGERPMEVALTAEAGMNDGLAFPFIYLAISVASYGWMANGALGAPEWFWTQWLTFDLFYRVAVGCIGGFLVGFAVSWVVTSPVGDARNGAWNAIVTALSATLLSYGLVEAVDGYGFLAVFFAARAGRMNTRGTSSEDYQRFVHHGSDQLETILLAFLLLWFGTFLYAGGMAGVTLAEILFAALLIFVIRPAAGLLSLLRVDCQNLERYKVAFFGVRGMGSVFYIAYAQNHAEFESIDAVWRIAAIVIFASIGIHGFMANFIVGPDEEEDSEDHPNESVAQTRPDAAA